MSDRRDGRGGRWRRDETPAEPPIIGGRIPPHDLEVEAAVLACVLLDEAAYDEIADLVESEMFYSDAHRLIWDAVKSLRGDELPVDVVTVAGWLRQREFIVRAGGAKYIGELVDATPSVARARPYADTVRELWRVRRTIGVCQKAAADGYATTDSDAQTYIDDTEQKIFAIAESRVTQSGPVRVGVAVQSSAARRAGGQAGGLATGFSGYDNYTGGLYRGDLLIVAARPGVGKTGWVLSVAANIARVVSTNDAGDTRRRQHVAVFSMEMPKEQVSDRFVAREAGVDLQLMRRNALTQVEERAKTIAEETVTGWPIWIDETIALTIPQLRARSRRIAAEARREDGELVLVAVDYLQLMEGEGESREAQVAKISRELKGTAKVLGVPVVALAQLNREVEQRGGDRRPKMSDLRSSGAIEQDADAILFLYREGYYAAPDEEDRSDGITELILAKQRNGPSAVGRARFYPRTASFDDIQGPQDEPPPRQMEFG